MLSSLSTIFLVLALFQSSDPQPCTWGTARVVGTLDGVVNESSGMAVSRRIPTPMYRLNDSGDCGRFFSMDLSGQGAKIINISGFNPLDTEDMAIGPCGESAD